MAASPLKRVAFAILPAVLLVLAVAACGPEAPVPTLPAPGPTPTVTVPVDLPVVVALGGRFRKPELAALDGMIADFEAANPDVWVEIVDIRGNSGQQHERIAARLGEGDASVDVYVVDDTWLAGLASGSQLLPLDDSVESYGLDPGNFLPPAIQAATIDGQLLALPWTVDSGVLYYRRDLLDRYGYSLPDDWAGIQHLALQVEGRADLPYGYVWQGGAYESLTCNTLEFVWSQDGRVLDASGAADFDSPQVRAALSQMRELITSGASSPDVTTYNEAKSRAAFENGEAVLMRHWASTWQTLNGADSPLAGQVGVAPLPASCLTGQSLALSAASQFPEQAFRLMAFLAGYKQQVQWAGETGRLPALEAAYEADPGLEALAPILAAARPLPKTAAYPAISEAIYRQVHELLEGEQDVETTAASVQQAIEAALGQH